MTSEPTIIRASHIENSLKVPHDIVNDPRLSMELLGVLLFLMSQPEGTAITPELVMSGGKITRPRARKLIRKLIKLGYLS